MKLWDTVRDFLSPKPAPVTPPAGPVAHVPQITVVPGPLQEPPFKLLVSNAERSALFGDFGYVSAPTRDNPEAIRILGDWRRDNIVWVPIPQLTGIEGAEERNGVWGMEFHRLGAAQLQALWQAWDDAGLLKHVLTFEGSFVARFVRGSRSNLSNHCYGNAFDINYSWNTLGAVPAAAGKRGSVRELVPLATQHGFFWGGFYKTRKDGMHFELAQVRP